MLKGDRVVLRQIRESELGMLWALHADVANRGDFYPRGVLSVSAFRKEFAESGFWTREEGTLLITTHDERIVGNIEWFPTLRYLSEVELSYQLFDRADDGKGYVSEAVRLLVRYLFETKPLNRIRLVIHPDNVGSKRVAGKTGFSFEGVMRGAWLSRGRYQDVELWSILHDEVVDKEPGRPG